MTVLHQEVLVLHNFIFVLFCYLLLGIFSGFFSGLLGVGSGIIVVPFLAYFFAKIDFPAANVMHLAISTSLAIIFTATLRGLFAYYQPGIKFWPLFQRFLPSLIIGSIGGAILGHYLHSRSLEIIFGFFVLLMAIKMLFETDEAKTQKLPGNLVLSSFGIFTGLQSGLLGLGGAVFMVPFLMHFGVNKHVVRMNALACGVLTSLVGTIAMIIIGAQVSDLPPWSIGYVYAPAWVMCSIGTLVTVPYGSRLAYHAPVVLLRRIFVVFLLMIAARLLWVAL